MLYIILVSPKRPKGISLKFKNRLRFVSAYGTFGILDSLNLVDFYGLNSLNNVCLKQLLGLLNFTFCPNILHLNDFQFTHSTPFATTIFLQGIELENIIL